MACTNISRTIALSVINRQIKSSVIKRSLLNGAPGPVGPPGSVWYEGAGAPVALHLDGDFYLNTTNGDVYEQQSAVWVLVGNIKGADGAAGYVIFQGAISGIDTLLDAVTWFNGKWDLIVRDGSSFYMSTITAVSDGISEPAWTETDIIYGGVNPAARCDVSAGQMRVLVTGTPGWLYEIKRHVFELMGVAPPPVPTLISVDPATTDDTAQLFTIAGTNLTQVTQVTIHDDAIDPAYYAIAFVIDNDAQISITGQAVQDLIAGGSVVPFSFRFRIWDIAAPRDFSDYIPVTAPPPANPMEEATFVTFSGGPGEIPVTVTYSPLSYALAALENPPGYEQTVPIVVPSVYEAYSIGVWFRRRDADGGLGTFVTYTLGGLNTLTVYTGAMQRFSVTVGPEIVESPAASWPDNDYDWHLLVVTRDPSIPGGLRLFIDGALSAIAAAMSGDGGDMLDSGNLVVGKTNSPFPNTQATAAFWPRPLTPSEIATIWADTTFPP